jgi:hypothetical protein
VRANRGAYLGAVFTIARAFLAAGCPKPDKMHAVAGFEGWSRWVQQPLLWPGMEDPFGGKEAMRAMDPTLAELQRVISVLRKYQGDLAGRFNVADCARLAEEQESDSMGRSRYKRQDLRDLMTSHGKINNLIFGHLLRTHRDRFCDGWCIKFAGSTAAGVSYELAAMEVRATAESTPQEEPR